MKNPSLAISPSAAGSVRHDLGSALLVEAGAHAADMGRRIVKCISSGGDPAALVESLGAMARASVALEEVLDIVDDATPMCAYIERVVTLRAVAGGRRGQYRTSLPDCLVVRDLARCLGYIVCELVECIELAQGDGPDLLLAIELQGDDLVLALAAVDGGHNPVPSGEGAVALRRAETLARAAGGGLTRGVRDGMMLIGMMLPVATSCAR